MLPIVNCFQVTYKFKTKEEWYCNISGKCKYKRGNFLKTYQLHLKDLGREE